MAKLFITRVQTGEAVAYWQTEIGEIVQVDTDVIPVAKGWKPSDKASYDLATLDCEGTGEVAPPVVVIPPSPLGFSTLGYYWDGDAFFGYAVGEGAVQLEGYLDPLDGQDVPISGFQYIPLSTTSVNVNNVSFNRAFVHVGKASGGHGVLPGRYKLYVRQQGETDPARTKTLDVVLSGASSSGVSNGYAWVGTLSVTEGGSTLVYVQAYKDGTFAPATGVSIALKNARTGLTGSPSANAITINCASNSVQGDSYTATLEASLNGQIVLTTPLQVLDASNGSGGSATAQFTAKFYEFVDADAPATLEIGRAFAGTNNAADTIYFVKNGSTTDAPGYSLSAPGNGSLTANNAMNLIAGFNYPAHWKFAFDAAIAAGYGWFGYAGIGNAGETVTARIRAKRSDASYTDYSYMRPIDGVNSSLTTVYSNAGSAATAGSGAYAVYTQTQQGVAGWPANTDRVYRFSDSLTNAQADSNFRSLSLNDKIAQTGTAEPAVPAGKRRRERISVRTGPAWASLRYSLSAAGELYVEGAGDELAKLRFKRTDGTSMSGSNSDGVQLNDTDFYGYGPNTDAAYPRQWKAVFTPNPGGQNITIVAQRTNGETFEHSFLAVSGAAKVQLYVAATTTAPGSGSNTLPAIDYGLILGNSLLRSGPLSGTDWQFTRGMAATDDNKDYYSLIRTEFRKTNPNFNLFAANQGAGLERVYLNNDDVTNNITNILSELTAQYGSSAKLSYIYVSLGENVDNSTFDATKMRSMLDRVLTALPKAANPILVFRNSVWGGKDQYNNFIQSYAVDKGGLLVDMASIRENTAYMNTGAWTNPAVDHHLNDAGMAQFTTLSLAPVRTSGGSGGGSGSGGSGSVPTLAGGWAEGTLSQLYALAPFTPTNNQVGQWAPNTEQLLSNDYVTIGIRKSIGGTLTRTVDKRWGFNMINTNSFPGPRGQYGTEDTGRSEDFSTYGHPNGGPEVGGHPYVQNGHTTAKAVTGDDTGLNPVPGGSRSLFRPAIEWLERKTINGVEVLYTRTTPYHWSILEGEISQSRRHAWHWLEGRVHKWVYLYENYRTDNQMIYEGRQQEGPFSYAIGDLYRQFVSFAADGVTPTEITMPTPYADNQTDTGDKLTSGSWIGAYDNQNRGYALIAPYCSKMGGKQFITRSGDEFSNESGYICVRTTLDFDTQTNFMVAGSKHIGTLSELADYLRTNPVQHRPFKYDFSGGLFQGWYTIDGPLRRINGEAVFGLGAPKGYNPSERGAATLSSPFGHFVAAQMPVLYLNMAVSGTTQVRINFLKVNQAEGDVYPSGQYKIINVTGDGQYRTYAVDMSGVPNYSGIICQFYFQNPVGYTVNGAETIKLGWFNTVNQKP